MRAYFNQTINNCLDKIHDHLCDMEVAAADLRKVDSMGRLAKPADHIRNISARLIEYCDALQRALPADLRVRSSLPDEIEPGQALSEDVR